MAAQTDDKKLDGAGLTTLWGIIKQYIADNPSIPKATASVLGGIMVGTTLAATNSGVLDLASGIVTAGTYKSVTVDTYGRVTAGSNPNTLAGYGITDAKIDNGAIILGADSITPATQTWVQQQGYTSNIGTVTQVKVGTSAYDPANGIISLPAYPTYSAATQSAAGLMSATDKTKLDGIASGANAYTLPAASTSALGGIKVNYTNSGKNYKVQLDSSNNAYVNVPWENTTYTFTNKGATLAWSTTSTIATIGGVDIKVTMPANPDTNTWRPLGTGATDACAGNDSRLSNSRPASDVYSWAKASTKPSYSWSEIGSKPFNWNGKDGQPTWLWGSNDGSNYYVWNPSNFSVNYASSAGNADTLDGYHESSFLHLTGGTMTGVLKVNSIYIGVSTDQINNDSMLHFQNNGRNISLCASGGNVGIGTIDTSFNLDVNGSVGASDYYVKRGGGIYIAEMMSGSGARKIYGFDSDTTQSGYYKRLASFAMIPDNDSDDCWQIRPWNGNFSQAYVTVYHGGNVGIGTTSVSYKLHVSGAVGATGFTNTSDIRKKNIIKDGLSVRLNDIANAPLFDFIWKDASLDKDLHIGSSAQYWKNVIPEAVTTAQDEMCTLSMQYDVIALASCISVAKETVTLKEKVALLETRVESLEKKIREYESN